MGLRRIVTMMAAASFPLAPLGAQESDDPPSPDDGRLVIDLTQQVPDTQRDRLAEEQCEEEADAGRIAGEIVVCRQLGETTDGLYNHEEFLRRYAEATQGVGTPDVDGTGLPPGMVPLVTIRGCFLPPCPPPPALIIDVEALPPPPAGSDADRIAQGLPPLGEDGDDGRGPISEEELGLPDPLSVLEGQ